MATRWRQGASLDVLKSHRFQGLNNQQVPEFDLWIHVEHVFERFSGTEINFHNTDADRRDVQLNIQQTAGPH